MDTEEQIRVKFAKLGRKKKPMVVFLGSMGDLFHPEIPADFIMEIFELMSVFKQHHYVILTKRPDRLLKVTGGLLEDDYLSNVFIGVSVENQATADERIPPLIEFKDRSNGMWKVGISAEPLLGQVDLWRYGHKLDWVLAGSETGHGARPAKVEWFEKLACQCVLSGAWFYLKQMGNRQHQDRILYDQEWNATAWGWK